MIEVAVTNCRSKPYSKAWCILCLHHERQQYLQEIVTLSPLPVIGRNVWYSRPKTNLVHSKAVRKPLVQSFWIFWVSCFTTER